MLDDTKTRSPTPSDPLLGSGEGGSDHDALELEELGEAPRWASSAGGTSRSGRCRIVEHVALAFLALLVLGQLLAPRLPSAAHDALEMLLDTDSKPDECDPYALPGVLRFDYENRSANFWEPALSQCTPRDYMTALVSSRDDAPELEFLRGRVVVFFGDSVDRFALKHFCDFSTGELETIGKDHPLMPPLPVGREHAPPGYVSHRNTTDWPASEMGVPHVCRLEQLDFHLVNVFQFGLFPEDEALTRHHHFLPPGGFEGRFDTFVVPLLENLAERRRADRAAALAAPTPVSPLRKETSYPITAAPDLFVTTPTFWNLMRRPDELPLPTGDWAHDLGAWAPPTRERQDWWEGRVQEAVEHVARAWGAARGSTKLVWRRLYTVYGENKWPVMKVRAQDDVAVRVIELLQHESRAAETSTRWTRWTKDVVPTLGASWRSNRTRDEVRELGLAERVKVLEWGKVFDGQQFHGTVDGVHPLPLPGNWVYSNMWLDVLRRHVEGRT
ncbi:hypothetical protein JCM8208_002665 [Rhodotorula glutinis]